MTPVVRVAGLPASGTRYLRMLVAYNYAVDVRDRDKHLLPDAAAHVAAAGTGPVLVIHKRYDRWLSSTLRNHYEYFLRPTGERPYYQHRDRHTPATLAALFADGFKIYSAFYLAWQQQNESVFVSYEELLRDSEKFLTPIAKKFNWPRKAGPWQDVGPHALPDWRRSMYLEQSTEPIPQRLNYGQV